MVKKLFFASFMLAVMVAGAQVTINSSNIIGANEPVLSSVDTLPPPMDLLGAGNQSWDFTKLNEDRIDTNKFMDAAETEFASDFPNANLTSNGSNFGNGNGNGNGNNNNVLSYISKNDTGLVTLGIAGDLFGSGTNHVIHILPNGQQMMFFPMTYQDNNTSNYYMDFKFDGNEVGAPVDSIRFKQIGVHFDTVDAYGQVDIPNASFDCIREKAIAQTHDSIWIYQMGSWTFYKERFDTTYTYNWYSDNSKTKFTVASVLFDPNDNQPVDSTAFSYLKFFPEYVNIPEGKGFGIYPNPAKDNFFAYGLVPGSQVELLDVTGNVILQQTVSSSKEKIDLSSVNTGIYFVKAVSGKKVYLKKLIVQ